MRSYTWFLKSRHFGPGLGGRASHSKGSHLFSSALGPLLNTAPWPQAFPENQRIRFQPLWKPVLQPPGAQACLRWFSCSLSLTEVRRCLRSCMSAGGVASVIRGGSVDGYSCGKPYTECPKSHLADAGALNTHHFTLGLRDHYWGTIQL